MYRFLNIYEAIDKFEIGKLSISLVLVLQNIYIYLRSATIIFWENFQFHEKKNPIFERTEVI